MHSFTHPESWGGFLEDKGEPREREKGNGSSIVRNKLRVTKKEPTAPNEGKLHS